MAPTKFNIRIGSAVFLYLWITYFLYLTLPKERVHVSVSEVETVIFLVFASIAFFFGCSSVSIKNRSRRNLLLERLRAKSKSSHFNLSSKVIFCILSILVLIQTFYIKDLINSGAAVLNASVGEAYAERLKAEVTTNSFWGQLYVIGSPFRVFMLIYCTYFFDKINRIVKVLYFLLIVLSIVYTIAQGVQVGIGNVAVYISVPLFFKKYQEKKLYQVKYALFVFALIFVAYFIFTQYSRAEALGSDVQESVSKGNNIYYIIFGKKIGAGIIRLLSYISHGYLGLSYSLQLPFEWTFGYGGSRALDEYLSQYLHLPSQFDNTYPMRVNKVFGYDCQVSWPTAFAWWASDFTFPGVVIWMYFIGKLTCMVFKDALINSNIFAIAFLCVLVIMIVFFPMNNQAFQGRDSLVITMALFFSWLYSKRFTTKKRSQNNHT